MIALSTGSDTTGQDPAGTEVDSVGLFGFVVIKLAKMLTVGSGCT